MSTIQHLPAAAGGGRGQDDAANDAWPAQGELLGDYAAGGNPAGRPGRSPKRPTNAIASRPISVRGDRNLAGGDFHAGVVEQDMRREGVDEDRIAVVEVA